MVTLNNSGYAETNINQNSQGYMLWNYKNLVSLVVMPLVQTRSSVDIGGNGTILRLHWHEYQPTCTRIEHGDLRIDHFCSMSTLIRNEVHVTALYI